MKYLWIRGGRPLAGEIRISGSKNAVLPMLAATVAFQEPCRIEGCPHLTDVDSAMEILRSLGAKAAWDGDAIEVDPRPICRWEIPPELGKKMRGSVFFTGPLLARLGKTRLGEPGGCPLGKRPVDYHRAGLLALGAREEEEPGVFSGALTGASIHLPYRSVGATENLILAALGAQGETVIRTAAREPEISCLCDFLRRAGCRITGDGTDEIRIAGGMPTTGVGKVIPDRMEAATYACMTACAGGKVRLAGADHRCLGPVLQALERAGCAVARKEHAITVEAGALVSPGEIITEPYPGFPTDAQAVMMAALLKAEGETVIREQVFDQRMHHVAQMRRMGARIQLEGATARVTGVKRLEGAGVEAMDLRGGAALAGAALGAGGETKICGVEHILRGYEDLPGKLRTLGADVRREGF